MCSDESVSFAELVYVFFFPVILVWNWTVQHVAKHQLGATLVKAVKGRSLRSTL
jgi:hypothetical protein